MKEARQDHGILRSSPQRCAVAATAAKATLPFSPDHQTSLHHLQFHRMLCTRYLRIVHFARYPGVLGSDRLSISSAKPSCFHAHDGNCRRLLLSNDATFLVMPWKVQRLERFYAWLSGVKYGKHAFITVKGPNETSSRSARLQCGYRTSFVFLRFEHTRPGSRHPRGGFRGTINISKAI